MGLEIDHETADRITVLSLKEQLGYLMADLASYKENGTWMHPEDVVNTEYNLIPAMEAIIDYYGG